MLICTTARLKPDHRVTSFTPPGSLFTPHLGVNQHPAALSAAHSRSNICLVSPGERLAPLHFGRQFTFTFSTQPEERLSPALVSVPSYAHADTNSCFELQPPPHPHPFAPCFDSAGSGLSLVREHGPIQLGEVCLPTSDKLAGWGRGGGGSGEGLHHSAHFSISVTER